MISAARMEQQQNHIIKEAREKKIQERHVHHPFFKPFYHFTILFMNFVFILIFIFGMVKRCIFCGSVVFTCAYTHTHAHTLYKKYCATILGHLEVERSLRAIYTNKNKAK